MQSRPYVFLIPGFLGFTHLGGVPYFCNAGEILGEALAARGMTPTLVRVETLPSSSLRARAARLAEVIYEHAEDHGRPIHLVAHSSGGLDARLLLTPGASLPVEFALEPLVARVGSLVTIATPHLGTPLASFFDGLFGQRVLWLASLCTAHMVRFGRAPVRILGKLAAVMGRGNTPQSAAAIEHLGSELLDALPVDNRAPLVRMLEHMGDDQALIPQLTPAGIEVLLAATGDRPGVRYGCVVARGPRPGFGPALRAGVGPSAQTTFAVYSALHRLSARMPPRRSAASDPGHALALARTFGTRVDWTDSDGVVPTLSQVWGEIIASVRADHLDVIGHFADRSRKSEHRDWLASGSGFDRSKFEAMWQAVAGFVATQTVVPVRAVAPVERGAQRFPLVSREQLRPLAGWGVRATVAYGLFAGVVALFDLGRLAAYPVFVAVVGLAWFCDRAAVARVLWK